LRLLGPFGLRLQLAAFVSEESVAASPRSFHHCPM
jgi:hypothetical protein